MSQYRHFRADNLTEEFRKIFSKLQKGQIPASNIKTFMQYAKLYYEKAKIQKEIDILNNLLLQWVYWSKAREYMEKGKGFSDIMYTINTYDDELETKFDYVKIQEDEIDQTMDIMAIKNKT